MKTVQLTQEQIDALRACIPARTMVLTKAVAIEQDAEWKAHLRSERDALEKALVALAAS